MPVNSTHPDYDAAAVEWSRARDVLSGEDAVKAGGEKYLPRLDSQSEDEFAAYRQRAAFLNATARMAKVVNKYFQNILRAGAWGREVDARGCRSVFGARDFHQKHVLEWRREREILADVGTTEVVKWIAVGKVAALRSGKGSGRSRTQSGPQGWNRG